MSTILSDETKQWREGESPYGFGHYDEKDEDDMNEKVKDWFAGSWFTMLVCAFAIGLVVGVVVCVLISEQPSIYQQRVDAITHCMEEDGFNLEQCIVIVGD